MTTMKKPLVLGVLCGALISVPVAAQEGASAPAAPPSAGLATVRLSKSVFEAAKAVAAEQTTQTPAMPQRPVRAAGTGTGMRVAYFASLGAAAAGTLYNIKETREGLDRQLEVRTFPLVWWKTSDPGDKSKVTGLVAGINTALMAVSAVAYHGRNPRTGILINALIAGATFAVGLSDHSKIKDDKVACPVISACR